MKSFTAVVEKCPDTGYFVGYIPGFAGAHSQGESLDEVSRNLEEVVAMLLEDGEMPLRSDLYCNDSDRPTAANCANARTHVRDYRGMWPT